MLSAKERGQEAAENALTFGSLFAGIGGMDLGLERAGWRCAWQVEFNPYCQEVLAAHWPDVPRYGDIKELNPDDLSPVDMVAGGFPCPPVSSAGLRRGRADDRWLWPHFARVLRHLRPRFVLVENVAAILHDNDAFGAVLGDLSSLGFDADWSVVPACAVGAPHTRDRLFLVAHRPRNDEPNPGASDPATGGLRPESRGSRVAPWSLDEWLPEREVGRVADGVPSRLVRGPLSALGNAVVPQVAELLGRQIKEAA